MKWLVLLFLLFLIVVFISTRYRRQINAAIGFWKLLQNNQKKSEKQVENRIENRENLTEVPLIKCADCGTWIPQNTALNIKSMVYFCSKECVEKAVKIN